MVTIKEIAQQLGVSPTTVSNVLNGRTGKMSPETRQKVQEALIQNHYVHESRHGDDEPVTHYVAVYCCLGDREHILMDPFCGELLEAAERELRKYGRTMVCGVVDANADFDERLKCSGLEGAVILGCLEENCEPLARRTGFPIVFIDSGRGNYDNIGLQDYEGGYEVASYMLKQGNDKIKFLS